MSKLFQIHHQFRDGTTQMCRQFEAANLEEIGRVITEVYESHPLPEDAQWMICTEESPHFWKTEERENESAAGHNGETS